MNAERFTETALQALASAQQIAQTRNHQEIQVFHAVTALLADSNSPAARVVVHSGARLEHHSHKLPYCPTTNQVLSQASVVAHYLLSMAAKVSHTFIGLL